jgi:hypothetical protein
VRGRALTNLPRSRLVTAVVAAAFFALAYDDGGYGYHARGIAAVAVWWLLALAIGAGLWPITPCPAVGVAVCALMAAFTLWTLASSLWAVGSEDAYAEFSLAALYLGLLAVVVLAVSKAGAGAWLDGLTVAIAAIAWVALVSRYIPGSFSSRGFAEALPALQTRLSFPLGYWNGLAIYCALGVPLVLRAAIGARATPVRGVAVAQIPALASVIYLASSRGGVATALAGGAIFLGLAGTGGRGLVVVAVGALGAAAALAVLESRDELVNGPLGTELVRSQGRSALILLILIALAAGAVWIGLDRLSRRVPTARRSVRRGAAVVALIAGAVFIVAADPVARFNDFRERPQALSSGNGGFVRAHLLSGNGSGRWQFWAGAVDEWRSAPLVGRGAGSYESWWAQHGSMSYFVRNAHSLYLETLGNLGLVGLALLAALFMCAAATGVSRLRQVLEPARRDAATAAALLGAFLVAAAIDWVWQLAAIGAVAFVAVGLLARLGTRRRDRKVDPLAWPWRTALASLALLVAVLELIPLQAGNQLDASQTAADREDVAAAFRDANAARQLEPWAASPYLQLALVTEQGGRDADAAGWIAKAIDRDQDDWRLWLVSSRLATRMGRVGQAKHDLRRAAELNPRSPLFAGLVGAQ